MQSANSQTFSVWDLGFAYSLWYLYTLPETNMAPEIRPSQKETDIPTIHF